MNPVYVEDLASRIGEEVEIRGFLYGKRASGKRIFLHVQKTIPFLRLMGRRTP